jgi:hypothetical protein
VLILYQQSKINQSIMLKQFFILCSGADNQLLKGCSEGEQTKFVGIGATVFLRPLCVLLPVLMLFLPFLTTLFLPAFWLRLELAYFQSGSVYCFHHPKKG